VFPTIAIEPCSATTPQACEWVIFVSVHAVAFGAPLIEKTSSMRIAAIGKATASALAAMNLTANIVPDAPFTSEALLAHAAFQPAQSDRVLIVRGEGGREMLRETLQSRCAEVNVLEIYRRVKPALSAGEIASLEERWAAGDIDAVTATSFETYRNLSELLTPRGLELLHRTTLVAPTSRIVDAASELGWKGESLIANSAEDAAILGTLARWQARARNA
jgi:uroporphyrinogen-III synthase